MMYNSKKKNKTWLLIIGAVVVVFLIFSTASALGRAVFGEVLTEDIVPNESFAIIKIYGTIQGGNVGNARVGYDHEATMDYIDSLMENDSNKGILLDVDSPGGTVYHSDEMYLKLMDYKEVTKRPIHAYFGSMAASGGYYISSSADYISANRNCWTGSIGVIISMSNLKGLYDKLGIQEILITSGANKGMGSQGKELTEEQYAIYQALVDESYNNFVDIVAKARGMTVEQVRPIADGRVYTAQQAIDNGLIDKIGSFEEAEAYMKEVTGVDGYYRSMYTPSYWESFFAKIESVSPKSDLQVMQEAMENSINGVPLYLYQG